MRINQNLRDLRGIAGMTQEEVANHVGLTRQAISGYESGRTQPDLDMIVRFAELYQADVSDILYGRGREQRRTRAVRIGAVAVFAAILVLIFSVSGLLFAANTLFPVPEGVGVTDLTRPLIELRFAILDIRTALQGAAQIVSAVGCLIMAVLFTGQKHLPPIKECFWAVFAFVMGAMVFTVPFGAYDPIYSLTDYVLILFYVFPPVFLLLIFRIVLGLIRTRRAKKILS